MKHQVFAVYDVKAEAYMRPYFAPTKGVGVRAFEDEVANAETPAGMHPEDYQLYILGEFDDNEGKFILPSAPLHVLNGVQVIAKHHSKSSEV